jgi:tensin
MFQFAAKRFSTDDSELTGITQPSQRRYVHYFSQILSQELRVRPSPVLLRRIRISAVLPMSSHRAFRPVFYIATVGWRVVTLCGLVVGSL